MDRATTTPETPSYEQQMFWIEFVELKTACCYVRDYRNALGKWVTGLATLRAVASSVSIAAWAIWQQHAYIWASIIALSQVADALRDVFPFAKRKVALSRWSRALDLLFVNAQRDWDEIAAGKCTDLRIRNLVHRLRKNKHQAQAKFIPEGLIYKTRIFAKAEIESTTFFQNKFGSIVE